MAGTSLAAEAAYRLPILEGLVREIIAAEPDRVLDLHTEFIKQAAKLDTMAFKRVDDSTWNVNQAAGRAYVDAFVIAARVKAA